MAPSNFKTCFLGLFEYYTPKIVLIKNLKVGVLNRLVQLAILGYIIGYVLIWNKGYQDFSSIESSVTSKVKGVVYTNFSKNEFNDLIPNPEVYHRIWDTADYVVPPSENNAFFVITNIVISSNQTQNKCPEDPDVPHAICNSDLDCKPGLPLIAGNGIATGKCVKSDINETVKVCEIQGWCPVERDVNPLKGKRALLTQTKRFTVLIKNFVDFPKFHIRRSNIPDYKDPDELKRCTYHAVENPRCPIFVLEDIVPGDYDAIAVKGASIAIIIDWECNFDLNPKKCFPSYKFRRLDENSLVAPGLNFRYGHYYGDSERTLYKAYGIKFIIMAQGKGGKFNIVPLLLNVGSGVGLLAVAKVLCDIVVLYVVKKRDIYKAMKYQCVADDNSNSNLESGRKACMDELYCSEGTSLKSSIA